MAKFISPMLATATDKLPSGTWVAETKYDGHRIVVEVDKSRPTDIVEVTAWSRLGNIRTLSTDMALALRKLPAGTYDGEFIVPKGHSYDVANLSNAKNLTYMIFDVLELRGESLVNRTWSERRAHLENVFKSPAENALVQLTPVRSITSWHDVTEFVGQIWDEGGEGAILKDVNGLYKPGKRTKLFLKVKALRTATLTIIGFAPSKGEVMQYGDYGTAVLKDKEKNFVAVKVLDNEVRARIAKAVEGKTPATDSWEVVYLTSGKKVEMHTFHPWVGRDLCIEFQERTEEGSYRHPRWDHLEGE